jgi:hypothetical protein
MKQIYEQKKNSHKECLSCKAVLSTSSITCPSCGYFVNSAVVPALTLSQSRGLVKAEPKSDPVSHTDWLTIESKLHSRSDGYCPICMEGFKSGSEVLLSCSHMYHRCCIHFDCNNNASYNYSCVYNAIL